ncbi:predicted protein [Verticillium alfalfae VaMs.102]|uniref:Predicted protein n=1 Tax=Verticillium alfalfae (strain VaMs.102 / ATCC MYA-4576 / FGSC 10136) TaxID=526221 RepID=C9SP89_VERA1|nr:predicted protein [Verticillium alfalfae VaMs.102]EEY20604.1 predicted protein [Verticillium alfalfae VaMs.102]
MTGAANSVQRDVEPGCKTGLYYITIANLPFGTSWHELKDWLRYTCIVEHVEIFNSRRLNQCEFGGRCIIADGRNATERIKIKELIGDPSSSAPSIASPHVRGVSVMTSPSYGVAVKPSATASPGHHGKWSARTPSTGVPYSPYSAVELPAPYHAETPRTPYYSSSNSTTGYTDAGGGYPYEMEPALGGRVRQPSYDYRAQQYAMYDGPGYGDEGSSATTGEHYSSSASSAGLLVTEQRKIIVKHLSSSSSEDQLRKLIKASLKVVTADKHQLQHIEFPRDNDGRLRGHIFATFKTPEVACGIVEELNGQLFQRKILEVRLTNEGVIRGLDQQQQQHHHEDWESNGQQTQGQVEKGQEGRGRQKQEQQDVKRTRTR